MLSWYVVTVFHFWFNLFRLFPYIVNFISFGLSHASHAGCFRPEADPEAACGALKPARKRLAAPGSTNAQ